MCARHVLSSALWIVLTGMSGYASDIYVDPAGTCGGRSPCFAAIQAAIGTAVDGDIVRVGPGTYLENINFGGKAITVTGEGGAEATIIDGNRNGSVVSFISNEARTAVLSNFTIQNGLNMFEGGGVTIQGASPTITGTSPPILCSSIRPQTIIYKPCRLASMPATIQLKDFPTLTWTETTGSSTAWWTWVSTNSCRHRRTQKARSDSSVNRQMGVGRPDSEELLAMSSRAIARTSAVPSGLMWTVAPRAAHSARMVPAPTASPVMRATAVRAPASCSRSLYNNPRPFTSGIR